MDYERLAAEFLKALRGGRSQTAFSRRLGYKSNVAYSWESGRRHPTASEAFRAASRVGIDVKACLARFYRTPPAWLADADILQPETVAVLLRDLQAKTPMVRLAASTGLSRFAIARLLQGSAEPKLPDFFRLIQACSLRLLDFCAAFLDPALLPSVFAEWQRLEAQRRLAYDQPYTQAFLRAIELSDYAEAPHPPGWLAQRLGVPADVEETCMALLEAAGEVRWNGIRWEPAGQMSVDTRRDPAAGRRLKTWWAKVGLQHLENGADGLFSYNVFSVSQADLERIRELHLGYFRALRAIVADSTPNERVVVVNLQLFGLDPEPTNIDRTSLEMPQAMDMRALETPHPAFPEAQKPR